MPHWWPRLQAHRPCAALRGWLQTPGSLTRALVRRFGGCTVHKVFQGRGRVRRDEAPLLGLPAGRRVHVREVVLVCGGRPLVAARSVAAAAHLRGPWRALRGLGTRPLAELLFQGGGVRREPLQYARLALHRPAGTRLHRRWTETTGLQWTADAVWARRSAYTRRGGRLLVMEVFDPALSHATPREVGKG